MASRDGGLNHTRHIINMSMPVQMDGSRRKLIDGRVACKAQPLVTATANWMEHKYCAAWM